MEVAYYNRFSLNEYKGKISSIVFTRGCNFRCPYCQNPELISCHGDDKNINEEEIFSHLEKQKGKLEGVVITGGEPLIQRDIFSFTNDIKSLGYLVKINTNGSNTFVLNQLIDNNLVDYVAMDIKAPLNKYKDIAYRNFDPDNIENSIRLLQKSRIDYEFRLTMIRDYIQDSHIADILTMIKESKRLVLNAFNNQKTYNIDFRNKESFDYNEMEAIKNMSENYVENVIIEC